MMNVKSIQILTVIMLFAISCQPSNNGGQSKEDVTEKSALQEEINDVKVEVNKLMNKIKNVTYEKRQETEQEVSAFVKNTRESIERFENKMIEGSKKEINKATQERINKLKARTDTLQKELKEMDKTAEEEWEETKNNIEKRLREINNDIRALMSDATKD